VASKSKLKGSAFEAKIRDILTEELDLKFERTPLSGSISYLKSDLWVPSDTAGWPYAIECKHYAELEFNNLLTAKSTDILQFWQQTIDSAKIMNKKPILIFRWNRSKDFIAWNDEIILDHQIEYRVFGYYFKMGLLTDWLVKYKASCLKLKSKI